MNTSIEDQILSIKDIMSSESSDYYLKGKTFDIKEDIKSWAGFWDSQEKAWLFESIQKSDPVFKHFQGMKGIWWEMKVG